MSLNSRVLANDRKTKWRAKFERDIVKESMQNNFLRQCNHLTLQKGGTVLAHMRGNFKKILR